MLPEALDPETLRTIAVVALVVIVVLALLVLRCVRKMVVRVVLIGVLIGLGAATWVQRAELDECRTTGGCTFFGQDVQVPGFS